MTRPTPESLAAAFYAAVKHDEDAGYPNNDLAAIEHRARELDAQREAKPAVSRSVARRIAAEKGEPFPTFDQPEAKPAEQVKDELCGCGHPADYEMIGGGRCCNKYSILCQPQQPAQGGAVVDPFADRKEWLHKLWLGTPPDEVVRARDLLDALATPKPAATEAKPAGFGIACTVHWTELWQAFSADGVDLAAKAGPAVSKWIAEKVSEYFAAAAQAKPVTVVDDAMVERGCVGAYNAMDMGLFPSESVDPKADRDFVRAALESALSEQPAEQAGDLGPMFGTMDSADFEADTITFRMEPDYYAAAGRYRIERVTAAQRAKGEGNG